MWDESNIRIYVITAITYDPYQSVSRQHLHGAYTVLIVLNKSRRPIYLRRF